MSDTEPLTRGADPALWLKLPLCPQSGGCCADGGLVSPRITACEDFATALSIAQCHEPAGFDWLFRRFGRPVKAFAAAQGHREPEDLVSDVFVAAFQSIGSFTGDENQFVSWLFRIARNKMIDHHRKAARRPVADTGLDEVEPPRSSSAESQAFASAELAPVIETLGGLTAEQRDVLVLRFVADLSLEQTSEVMGRSVGAVKQLQHRALEGARRLIRERAVT